MIKQDRISKYLKAIKIGFEYYGLNGFYEMHKDVCENPSNPWGYDLQSLNDLSFSEFESLCNLHLKNSCII